MIAKVAALRGAVVGSDDPIFRETCRDVLRIDAIKITREGAPAASTWLDEILDRYCVLGQGHDVTSVGRARGLCGQPAGRQWKWASASLTANSAGKTLFPSVESEWKDQTWLASEEASREYGRWRHWSTSAEPEPRPGH